MLQARLEQIRAEVGRLEAERREVETRLDQERSPGALQALSGTLWRVTNPFSSAPWFDSCSLSWVDDEQEFPDALRRAFRDGWVRLGTREGFEVALRDHDGIVSLLFSRKPDASGLVLSSFASLGIRLDLRKATREMAEAFVHAENGRQTLGRFAKLAVEFLGADAVVGVPEGLVEAISR